jgi:hypothetical protein
MEPLRRTRAGGLRQCGGRETARCDRKADCRTLAAARGAARQALVARPPVRAPSRERSRCLRHSRRRDGRRRRSEPTTPSTRDRNTTRGPISCAEPLPSTSSSVPVVGGAYGWWRRSPTRRPLRPSCATSAYRWTSPCPPGLGARSRGRRRSRPATIRSRRRRAAYPPRSVWGPFSRARRGRSDCRLPKSGGQRPRSVRAAPLRGHGAAATPLTTRLSAPWLGGRLVAQRGERGADPTSLGLRQIGG